MMFSYSGIRRVGGQRSGSGPAAEMAVLLQRAGQDDEMHSRQPYHQVEPRKQYLRIITGTCALGKSCLHPPYRNLLNGALYLLRRRR